MWQKNDVPLMNMATTSAFAINDENFDIKNFSAFRSVQNQYSDDFIRSSMVVKIREDEKTVSVATKKSVSKATLQSLALYHPGKIVKFVEVTDADFEEFIGRFFLDFSSNDHFDSSFSAKKAVNVLEKTDESDVVNIINSILIEAIRNNCSDIHFEPFSEDFFVRFRIDGVLSLRRTFPSAMTQSITNRLKIMANLNIMEKRLPQDGHIETEIAGDLYDLRISCVPVAFGESIVIRIFNSNSNLPSLEKLGFSNEILAELQKVPCIPHGMVLFTGPTGSGKTTTMHSIIEKMDKSHLKIITIEDPIERKLTGVCQIQVNEDIGLTFDSILAKVLRQDPNVIMIGEIRDSVTANLAVRSALTGHLILATIHANDSVSVLERLENLGIEPYMISCVLRLVVSQRLVRCVAQNEKNDSRDISQNQLLAQNRCIVQDEKKGVRYKGRTVVSEMLLVDSSVAEKISHGEKIILSSKSMKEDAEQKLKNGITTLDELSREGLI